MILFNARRGNMSFILFILGLAPIIWLAFALLKIGRKCWQKIFRLRQLPTRPVLIHLLHFADVSKNIPDIRHLNSEAKANRQKSTRTFIESPRRFWYKYQPFTPPRATPAIMYLDNSRYTTISGSTVRERPKYTEPYSVL